MFFFAEINPPRKADAYIEKTARELTKNHKVTVATSDRLEQMIIFGSGAFRIPASQLEKEIESVDKSVRETVEEHNLKTDGKVFSEDFAEQLIEWLSEHKSATPEEICEKSREMARERG